MRRKFRKLGFYYACCLCLEDWLKLRGRSN